MHYQDLLNFENKRNYSLTPFLGTKNSGKNGDLMKNWMFVQEMFENVFFLEKSLKFLD